MMHLPPLAGVLVIGGIAVASEGNLLAGVSMLITGIAFGFSYFVLKKGAGVSDAEFAAEMNEWECSYLCMTCGTVRIISA